MAILKKIELQNGVVLNYHRVVSLNTITNVQNVIEVASYTGENKRQEEIDAIANSEDMDVYIHTQYLSAPYDQTMTVEGAYNWIKENVESFNGAEDC